MTEMFLVHVLRTKEQIKGELEDAYVAHTKLVSKLGQPNSLNSKDLMQWSQNAKGVIELIQANISCISTYSEVLLNEEGEENDK